MQVEKSKQQLEAINAFIAANGEAITTLLDLELKGFSRKDITELISLVSVWQLGKSVLPSPYNGNGRKNDTSQLLNDKLIGH
jgi:hypothetical protein